MSEPETPGAPPQLGQYPPGLFPPPPPRRRWSTAAIVALVLVVALGVPALLVAGVYLFGARVQDAFDQAGEPARDSKNRITEAQDVATARIKQGDCLSKSGLKPLDASDSSEEIEIGRVRLVPCSQVHEVEAYLNGNLSGGSYPGTTEITIQVADRCRREFRTFIGMPLQKSRLDVSYYYPLKKTWAFDKGFTCVVYEPDMTTRGSLRDARR